MRITIFLWRWGSTCRAAKPRKLRRTEFEKTTAKYSDSSRINKTPQRFLTKFLKIRLKDFLVHETELYRLKHIEVNSKRADLRDLNR